MLPPAAVAVAVPVLPVQEVLVVDTVAVNAVEEATEVVADAVQPALLVTVTL